MKGKQYVALLRGINVGGNNLIKMADLKASLEEIGMEEVRTYIQSGNVIFRSEMHEQSLLESQIEQHLSAKFAYNSVVVLLSEEQLKQIVLLAPEEFGKNPDEYRYNVLFIKTPMTAENALQQLSVREGVDTADAGNGVLYFSNLISKASRSHLTKIITLPVYKQITIRNWNTTLRLFSLLG